MFSAQNFNPPSPWGEGLGPEDLSVPGTISIHPPRGGRDQLAEVEAVPYWQFQSTLPVGGGTELRCSYLLTNIFQSTLPVGGGT